MKVDCGIFISTGFLKRIIAMVRWGHLTIGCRPPRSRWLNIDITPVSLSPPDLIDYKHPRPPGQVRTPGEAAQTITGGNF